MRGQRVFLDLSTVPGGDSQAAFRRIASALEELTNSGKELPEALPGSVSDDLERSGVKLTRAPDAFRLDHGSASYSSLDGASRGQTVEKETAAGTPGNSPGERPAHSSMSPAPVVRVGEDEKFTARLGAEALAACFARITGGAFAPAADLGDAQASYSFQKHRGVVWLHIAATPVSPKESLGPEQGWAQLPDAPFCLLAQSGFLSDLVRVSDPAVRSSLPARLWLGQEGWQGIAIGAPPGNFGRVAGQLALGTLPATSVSETAVGSTIEPGTHDSWTVTRPDRWWTVLRTGYPESSASTPSPLTMWKRKELPGTPLAMGRFNLLNAELDGSPGQTTISWVAGSARQGDWVVFQDQGAPTVAAAAAPTVEPACKSVHRIRATILAGQ